MSLSFSVAISVYRNDAPEHFDRALESITDGQTRKPDEIVLVADGPVPEETNAVIEKYAAKFPGFRVVRLEKNQGLGNALNVALEHCQNELVARMDSDDVAAPDRFEKQIRFLEEHPDVDIVGGTISEFVDTEANIVGCRVVPERHGEICGYLKTRCPFNHMTVMFKKTSVLRSGGYLDWFWNEDYYLWIRMYLAGMKFANLADTLVNVRTGKDMYKRRGGWKYFQSELGLQNYMRRHKIIGWGTYGLNVAKRLVLQVLLPNSLRGYVFKKFARSTPDKK